MEKIKVCNVCKIKKHIDEFAKQYNKPAFRCKQCLSEYNKKYYQKNQEKLKKKTAKFRKEYPEYMVEWRKNNKDKTTQNKREWIEKNRDKINKNERQRRKKDYAYRIKKNLRRRVNEVITRSNKKCDSTLKLLGCSLEEFLQHLEKQFTPEMNWDNYGSYWHVDHIKPKSLFEYKSIEDDSFKKSWSLSNLQPLEALENIKKGNKYKDD